MYARLRTFTAELTAPERYLLFGIVLGLYLVQALYVNHVLLSDGMFYRTFEAQLAASHIDAMLEVRQRYVWVSYLVMPLYLLLKIGFTAFCLFLGALLADYDLRFSDAFKVGLVAEGIFVVAAYAKAAWLSVSPVETIQALGAFYPLSLLSVLGPEAVAPWLHYPLQLANPFEVGYWLLLAAGLCGVLRQRFRRMLGLVVTSYGAGLAIYVAAVVFLSLNLS